MSKKIINSSHAPAAVGPYSQAVRIGNIVYTAGQIGIDPATGKMQDGLEAQTKQVMANLQAVLEAAGTGFTNVVKTTIYITDMSHFSIINNIYGSYFDEAPPARSTVAVSQLPLGALVEIEAVAFTTD